MQGTWENGQFVLAATKNERLKKLEAQVSEARQVLERLAKPGWLSEALESGNISSIAKEVCALKREARAVLAELVEVGHG